MFDSRSNLVGSFPRIQALRVHDGQVQGGVRALEEIGPFPQLHGLLVVALELLVVPGQGVDGRDETLRRPSGRARG